MKKKSAFFSCSILFFFSSLLFACNNGSSNKTNQDSAKAKDNSTAAANKNKNDTTVVFYKNCHTETKLSSGDTTLSNWLDAEPSEKDTSKSMYHDSICIMTMSISDFANAIKQLDYANSRKRNYDYLAFDFKNQGKSFYLEAKNVHLKLFVRQTVGETDSPFTLTQTQNKCLIESTEDVRGGQKWWRRRGVICREAAEDFANRIKTENNIDLLNPSSATQDYMIVITPKVDKDDKGKQYVSLILSVKEKPNTNKSSSNSAITTVLKTNPCPYCQFNKGKKSE
jgi:hypothetical protein